MSEAAKRLLEEAMRLSPDERSMLGRQLLDSVDVANDEIAVDELAALDEAIEDSYADEAAGRVRDVFDAFPQLRSES